MDISTSINSAITALQTHIGALQESLEDQASQLKSENNHLLAQSERLAEVVATRNSRIEELEEQNRRQARRIEFLESREAEAGRRESVANRSENTRTACGSPNDSNTNTQRPTARPNKNVAAVAAARAAVAKGRIYFTPAPIAPKYSQNPQLERDNGTALRTMFALENPSQIVAVDCFPGREWKVSVCELPKQETEEESAEIKREANTEEGDEKAVALYSERPQAQGYTTLQERPKSGRSSSQAGVSSVLEFGLDADKGRKRSLPVEESANDWLWRKAICEYCWTHRTFCDFQGYGPRFNPTERKMLIIQVGNAILARA
ncbi:hypothetical protein KC332_g490 [Hortaea werneckii]|nr:hypothetical protein KC350_g2748 [Hortaea werneckii]KAI6850601.1 hypothetical protein KC358_g614 [Hortaea werneckii]KAI6944661.1 hypothetical protein KC341_g674 [Hortaea werneckii]KAI6950714.1 hypothetical protein KC348_g517 [Hortaea werneckii]KAI6982702.1 hypothetical protein KC321_g501 [Hortaea werneckii]